MVNVTARLVHTYKEGNDVIELYEANQLSGNCSVVMKKVSVLTDKDGNWIKIVDTWQGDKMIEPESGSTLLLSLNTTQKRYEIHSSIFFAQVEGTIELSNSKGTKSTSETDPWSVNADLGVEDKTDGNLIIGHFSKPAADKMVVTPQTGFLPGTTWNWSLSRTKAFKK